MNRPWGLMQFTQKAEYRAIEEDYLLLMETDHLMLKPMPNTATPTTPVGFGFYYMTYKYDSKKLRPVIAKYHDPEQIDNVGPSPLIIHKPLLSSVVRPWWELCLTLKADRAADAAFGWVLEMWGWAIGTARLGIRHTVLQEFQAEPTGEGIDSVGRYYLYHYTFDLASCASPTPSWAPPCASPVWKFSKRSFGARYPPRALPPPPDAARKSTVAFTRLMNEAMGAVEPWAAAPLP